MIVQIDGRRRRRADHHELADRQRRQRDLHAQISQDHPERPRTTDGTAALRALLESTRDRERIRSQEDLDEDCRQPVADEADEKRARRPRDTDLRAGADRRRHQIGPDQRAERRAPYDQSHGAPTLAPRAHVGRGVTAEQVGGLRDPEERHPDEQQREALDQDTDHAEHGAAERERVAEDQSGPTSGAVHQARQRPARERGAERADGHRQTRPRVRAGDAGRHDAADRHADRVASAPADLRGEQRGHQLAAALHLLRRRCRSIHRGVSVGGRVWLSKRPLGRESAIHWPGGQPQRGYKGLTPGPSRLDCAECPG